MKHKHSNSIVGKMKKKPTPKKGNRKQTVIHNKP